ncbi:MAG: TlpA family protein disulfide reductase [Acidobacteriota bacterium]|nr:TlpA family protein disulfide reductase [Acidobacteriota bacterium]
MLFAGIAGAAILLVGGGSVVRAQRQSKQTTPTEINLRGLDGANVIVSGLRTPAVLAVGASWLPLSRDQVKIINALQQNYAKRGVALYFVSTDSADAKSNNYATDAQLTTFGERSKLGVTTLRDPQGVTVKAFGLDQIPAFVVLDKDGSVAAKFTGIDPKSDLAAQISAEIDKIL